VKPIPNVNTPQFQTKGLGELSSLFVNMWGLNGNKSIKKAVTRSVRKGTTVLRKAYRDAAPNGPKKDPTKYPNHRKMRKSVRQKVRRPQKRKNALAKVGFNVGTSGKGDKRRAYHAHLPVVGTKLRYHKSGKFVGRVRPSNVIGNKVDAAYPKVIAAIETEFTNYINSL